MNTFQPVSGAADLAIFEQPHGLLAYETERFVYKVARVVQGEKQAVDLESLEYYPPVVQVLHKEDRDWAE